MVRVFLDVKIGDQNRVHSLSAKIRDHFLESREVFPVDRERCVALLIIDIEIDGVGRYFFLAERLDDLPRSRFGIVGIAALLVAECPERRQRRASRHGGVFFDDFLGIWSGNEVVVQVPAFSAKGKIILRLFAEIKDASIGVVEEKAISDAVAKPDEKGNGFV